ncbi:hypothetical protein DL765_007442 [Monosporascus sp. GIB2]|nr:hypothetical protein DL765_007442 [Monosporascus sp. GIB2]
MTNNIAMRYSSSPELSDPPSVLSGPTSPNGYDRIRNGGEGDEIIVDPSTIRYDGSGQPLLTKDGLPRRKPGPKPGSKIGKRSSTQPEEGEKVKRTRKPKDPNAPPAPRKRKAAPAADEDAAEVKLRAASIGGGVGVGPSTASRQPKITDIATTQGRLEPISHKVPKRDSLPESMSKILNADPEPQHSQLQAQPLRPTAPSRTSGTNYDPIRSSNYDPVRETMVTHSYSNPLASPRAPTGSVVNRASASPSIASLVDPTPVPNVMSPAASHTSFAQNLQQAQSKPRKPQESSSMPTSPDPPRKEFAPPPAPKAAAAAEVKKPAPPPAVSAASKIEIRPSSITTIGAGPKRTSSKNQSTASSSPRINAAKESLLSMPGGTERSILDFGRAEPGTEKETPSIILNIPLNGETNKYVNFMRMAEDQYGWEALHPRQAEHKARKARIAAASAALAQNDSSREGDEMSVDESENEDSNIEMGGMSGPDKPDGKPAKKKRHFKEDEYDKDDDFVDDSELLWEEQAAASRDGFFVYSGPLVPDVEKPEAGRGDQPKRGRGSRGGRGGGRGAATGTGRGRGGGPGSRGGVVRKPRMTKADKEQMNREKAQREAAYLQSTNSGGSYVLHPGSPPFAGL